MTECKCVGKHVPLPMILNVHHVVPQYYGGETSHANLIKICPTTHDNVHELLREYDKLNGPPPGQFRKHYSKYVQTLAKIAWQAKQAGSKRPLTPLP